jgi:phospholipase C
MTTKNRRDFLRASLEVAGAAAALNVMPIGIRQALAIPANNRHGSIEDIEHIVVLMQENRAFDHYFGTLRGVRGYGDKAAVTMKNGKSVFHQPLAAGVGELLPFHPSASNLGLQFLQDLPHDWVTGQAAFNAGRYDGWVPAKGTTTMAYLRRDDIPFHYRLADAFTICDAYHCSTNTSTDPNRYYMWTGYVGNDGTGGGPVIDNAEAGYGWSTFPEVLEKAGISWKIYQDEGTGLDKQGSWGWTSDAYIGNYGDNSLLYFTQYQNAQPGSPLYEKARRGTTASTGDDYFRILKQDVASNSLPQVSWIVAPEAFSEHPNWPANYGAWYVDQVLQVLTSNPDLWSKTALLINYDENDGFFDHVVPPFPASGGNGKSTVDVSEEIYPGSANYARGVYGLGARVPMLVVSPWSKGGWVCSETFDHTSVIRFIQKRFGRAHNLAEPNITPWRKAVCGDLTAAFDFRNPNAKVPPLPSTASYAPADKNRHNDYVPLPPVDQKMPQQESGVRPSRALGYELFVRSKVDASKGTVAFNFVNTGDLGGVFLLYSAGSTVAPNTYTVEAKKRLRDQVSVNADDTFDFVVHGPNGFLRRVAGKATPQSRTSWGREQAAPEIAEGYDVANGNLQLRLENNGTGPCVFSIVNAYQPSKTITKRVAGGDTAQVYLDLRDSHGWYDVDVKVSTDSTFARRLAGRVETGKDGMSDPAFGVCSE